MESIRPGRASGDVPPPPVAAEQAALAAAAGALAGAGDLDAALRALFAGLRALLPVDSSSVRLPAGAEADFRTYQELTWQGGEAYTRRYGRLRPGGDTARLLERGQAQYVADVAQAAAGNTSAWLAWHKRGIGSSLRAPLRAGGRVVGVLYANSRHPDAFAVAALGPLQVLADHAGAAVALIQLRVQAQEQLRRLDVAMRVSTAVNAADDLDGMLGRVLTEAAQLVGAAWGTVALVDADRRVVRGRVGLGVPPGLLEATERRLYAAPHPEEDIFALVVRTGEQTVVKDDQPALHRPTTKRFGLYQEHRVFTPIRHAGAVIGVLTVSWTGEDRPGDEHLALLRLIAEQAGGAIARARLAEAERAQLESRLAVEAALRASEARYRRIVETAQEGIWVLDATGRTTYVNRRVGELLGDAAQAILDRPATDFVDADARQDLLLRLAERAAGQRGQYDLRLRRLDGAAVWVLVSATPLYADDGRYLGSLGMLTDITQRKRDEAALAEHVRTVEAARAEARAILDATDEGIALVAPDGRYVSANRRFAALFGLDQQALPGRRVGDFSGTLERVFDLPDSSARFAAYLADPTADVALDLRQRWPAERDLKLFSTPVRAADGRALGRLFAFRDVTRERAADRMKEAFVATVSHELRTPLTSIKGYVDILLDEGAGPLLEQQREFLEIVRDSTDREVALVNDLLDIARLEAGHVRLRPVPLDLVPLLRQVTAALRPQLAAKRQRLALDLPRALPPVAGDAARLAQVFTNLLANAHQYTPAGGRIAVTAGVAGDHLRVDVRDSGIGIAPDDQARLFTKFFRAGNVADGQAGGTGLGLAISRSLVELHGGRITVTSAPGAGSAFSVTVPRLTAPPERLPSQ